MMVNRDSLLTEEIKRITDNTASIRKTEQKPAEPNLADKKPAPDLGRSVFSNQVSDAKADLKMGSTIDVRL